MIFYLKNWIVWFLFFVIVVDFYVKINVKIKSLMVGVIVGIVVGVFIFVFLVFVFWWKGYLGGKDIEDDGKVMMIWKSNNMYKMLWIN